MLEQISHDCMCKRTDQERVGTQYDLKKEPRLVVAQIVVLEIQFKEHYTIMAHYSHDTKVPCFLHSYMISARHLIKCHCSEQEQQY